MKILDKEPPPLTKEEKKLFANTHYAGGIAPLHFTIIKEQNKCRIDFIAPALDPSYNTYLVTGINGYAILDKQSLGYIMKAIQNAYDMLK